MSTTFADAMPDAPARLEPTGLTQRPSAGLPRTVLRWLTVLVAVSLVGVINWKVFGYVHANHSEFWPGLRRHVLGPFDGFPLVRSRLYWCFAAAFAIDFVVLRRRSAIVRLLSFGRSERTDMAYAAVGLLGLGAALPALFTFGLSSIAPSWLSTWRAGISTASPEFSNPVVQILFYTIVVDFLRYWWHRWMHESKLLWKFHEVHHEATSFTIFTGTRQHPVEYLLSLPVVVVPLVLLGASSAEVAVVIVVRTVLDLLQHSMIPFTYGWFGRWVFFSPVDHRIHHSPRKEHYDTNFGDFCPVWDHIFGTWYKGNRIPAEVGAPDREPRGFVRSVFEPFGEAAALLVHRPARQTPAAMNNAETDVVIDLRDPNPDEHHDFLGLEDLLTLAGEDTREL